MSTHTIWPKELNQQERMKRQRNTKEGGGLPEAFYGCTIRKQQAYHEKNDGRQGVPKGRVKRSVPLQETTGKMEIMKDWSNYHCHSLKPLQDLSNELMGVIDSRTVSQLTQVRDVA